MWIDRWESFTDFAQMTVAQAGRRGGTLSLLLVAPAGEAPAEPLGGSVQGEMAALAPEVLRTLRWSDPATSYNPQCLAMLAVDTGTNGALRVAERIRRMPGGKELAIGIAAFPQDGSTLPELMARAGAALAQASAGESVRIVTSSPPEPVSPNGEHPRTREQRRETEGGGLQGSA